MAQAVAVRVEGLATAQEVARLVATAASRVAAREAGWVAGWGAAQVAGELLSPAWRGQEPSLVVQAVQRRVGFP
jgi:hypothetical protein